MLRVFNNLNLLQKLLIPLAILVAVMGVVLWQARSGLISMGETASQALDVSAVRLENALVIEAKVNAATVGEKNIILERRDEAMQAHHDRYKARIKEALEAVERLIALAKYAGAEAAEPTDQGRHSHL